MSDLTDAQEKELARDLATDLDELRASLNEVEEHLSLRIRRAVDQLERLTRSLQDSLYAVEDRVRRLENSR